MHPRHVLSSDQVKEQLFELMRSCNRGVITRDEYDAILRWFDQLERRLADPSNPKEDFGDGTKHLARLRTNQYRRVMPAHVPKFRLVEVTLDFAVNDDAVQILHFSLTPPI